MPIIKPRLTFTIGADKDTHLRIQVLVWRTQKELNRARQRCRNKGEKFVSKCDGFCFNHNERHVSDLTIADLHFSADNLSVETIVHEAVHAAVIYTRWIRPFCGKFPDDSRDMCATVIVVDESIAYSAGFIAEGVIWNLRREKMKIKPL